MNPQEKQRSRSPSPNIEQEQEQERSRPQSPVAEQDQQRNRSPSPLTEQNQERSITSSPSNQQEQQRSRSPSPTTEQNFEENAPDAAVTVHKLQQSRSSSPDVNQNAERNQSVSDVMEQKQERSRSPSPVIDERIERSPSLTRVSDDHEVERPLTNETVASPTWDHRLKEQPITPASPTPETRKSPRLSVDLNNSDTHDLPENIIRSTMGESQQNIRSRSPSPTSEEKIYCKSGKNRSTSLTSSSPLMENSRTEPLDRQETSTAETNNKNEISPLASPSTIPSAENRSHSSTKHSSFDHHHESVPLPPIDRRPSIPRSKKSISSYSS